MPIGKNSIKRVANNGYSKVTTTSPDMENSEVLTEKKEPKKTTKTTSQKKAPTQKKPEAKPTAKKTTTTKKATPEKKAEAPKEKEIEIEKSYFNVGDTLPIYLL